MTTKQLYYRTALRANPPRTRRPVLSPLYGAGVGAPDPPGGSWDPGSRETLRTPAVPGGPLPGSRGVPGPSGAKIPYFPQNRGKYPKTPKMGVSRPPPLKPHFGVPRGPGARG